MTTFNGKMGDPFESREHTVQAMIRKLGRDTSDMTLTPGTITDVAALEDDPDVRNAWDCLVQVTAEVLTRFNLFNTAYFVSEGATGDTSLAPGSGGSYYITPTIDTTADMPTAVADQIGAVLNNIASVKILSQPSGLRLVYRGEPSTAPRLFDLISKTYGSFAGMGNVECAVTYWMQWEYIPFVFRNYIFQRATRLFVEIALGAEEPLAKRLEQEEGIALARAQAYDLEQSPVNMRDGTMWDVDDRNISGAGGGDADDIYW